jgi:manganese transport protein
MTVWWRRIWTLALTVGPGIFCIGYTIGTGSVTAMLKAGSEYRMGLLWVLGLSCLFSWVLMEAFGRFAVVTGSTAIRGFRENLPFGRGISVLVIVGIVFGQWNSLAGILGLSSNAVFETAQLLGAGHGTESYWPVLLIAVTIVSLMYLVLLRGEYALFEKILLLFVSLMGLSFVISTFIVPPRPADVIEGLLPRIPDAPGASLMVAAFVGTTMAAPTFVVRPLLVKAKGWSVKDYRTQQRDAFFSASLMFAISAAVMAVATGALADTGRSVDRVLDMVEALTPLAGPFAVVIFMVGVLSAGLSSVFPILMVAPLLIGDYRKGRFESRSKLFRSLTAVACLVGLAVPVLGASPVYAQIVTQVFNVFVLPVVILGVGVLVNRSGLMGRYRAGLLLNLGLLAAFAFSVLISLTGILALREALGF